MRPLPIRHISTAALCAALAGCFGASDFTQTATGEVGAKGPSGDSVQVDPDACDSSAIDPGRVTLHRLNRAEYNNTVRDLLGDTTQPAKDFPADDHGYGFDNNADVLSLAPLLMEKYDAAAEKLIDTAWAKDFTPGQSTHLEAESAGNTVGSSSGSAWNLYSNGSVYATVDFVTSGDFVLSARAWGQRAGPDLPKMEFQLDNLTVASFDVDATSGASKTFSKTVKVTQGKHTFAVAFINDYYDPNNADPAQRDRNLLVDWFEVKAQGQWAGTDSKLRICDPTVTGEAACAQQILSTFARRAWRRPATASELDRMMGFLTLAKDNGDGFDAGVKLALQAILLSPNFLFRVELDPDPASTTPHRVTDLELASRLSYFLWSSTPDEELLSLAEQHQLSAPQTLSAQVDRMLEDPKSEALVQNFAGQWLETRAVDEVDPNKTSFPQFDDALREDIKAETDDFFRAFLHEQRPVREMLDADFTFLNDRLAAHYGLPPVGSEDLQRVTLPADSQRGGLLRQASFLAITSHANRTSPVKRGKWVLSHLLCKEPPPPPPGVQSNIDAIQLEGTLRQKLEEHRSNPSCSGCHALMDPIGFGFENYDAIGQYRTKDEGFDVDASGALPDGQTFTGPAELAQILKADPNLSKCVTQNLMVYALGRGNDAKDTCALQQMADTFDARGGSFRDLIHVITESEPFTMRRGEAEGGQP